MTGLARERPRGPAASRRSRRFRTQMPVRFTTAEEDVWVNAVLIEIGPDGLARSIEPVLERAPD